MGEAVTLTYQQKRRIREVIRNGWAWRWDDESFEYATHIEAHGYQAYLARGGEVAVRWTTRAGRLP
jgi:hypothetical protein